MITNLNPLTHHSLNQINKVWRWLTAPPASIQKPQQRRRAQLLSALLLPMILFTWFWFFLAPEYEKFFLALIGFILVIAYGLSRTKFCRLGALLIVAVAPLPTLWGAFNYPSYNKTIVTINLMWLIIPLLMGSLWLSVKDMVFVFIGYVMGILLLALLIPAVTFWTIDQILFFIIPISLLVLIASALRERDQREAILQTQELRANEERLRTVVSNAPLVLSAMDSQGIYTLLEGKGLDKLGVNPDEFIGKSAFETLQNMPQLLEDYHLALSGQAVNTFMEIEDLVFEIKHTPLSDNDGQVTGVISLALDITERKQAEEELRRSRDFMNNFINALDDLVFVKDEEHRWIILNDAICEVMGKSREELIGKSDYDFFPKEQADVFWEKDQLVFDTEEINVNEEEITWNGEIRTISTKKSIFKDLITGQKYIVGTSRDMTERKQVESEIRQRAAQLALINDIGSQITVVQELETVLNRAAHLIQETFNYHHVAMFLRDGDLLRLRAISGAYEPYFPPGHTQKIGEGLNGWVATHGEKIIANDVSAEPRYISLISDHTVTRSELTLPINVDGQTVGVLDIQSPEINGFSKNDVIALEALANQIAVAVENTRLVERIQQELVERQQAEKRYRNLFEEAPVMYVITDNQEGNPIIADCNELFLNTLGYSRTEVIGEHLGKFYTAESEAKLLEGGGFQKALAGKFVADNRQLVTRDGRVIETLLQTSVETNITGQVVGTRAMFSDITELKQTETALHRAKEEAEAASRAKSEFLANMSHEIRTPMNGIIGMTELALDTELTPAQREYLEMVKSSANSLLTVINDILDFSKIEAGRLDLYPTNFDLSEALGTTMQTLALRAHEKGLELAYHIPPEVPINLVGDPGRLRQIIVNLVGNAIKFTDHGEVVLYVDVQSKTETETCLHFTVKDTGIGIPPEKQHLIFDAFSQADGSITREFEGTGLGLAISSQLTVLMGGQIWVESQVGQGSKFHFTARFGRHHQNLAPVPVKPATLKALPVLVVDDNTTNRRILVEMLTNWQMKPTAVDGGYAALAELKQAAAEGRPYSLILLDAMMPEMDGFTLAQQIKHDPQLIESTIMMLSSADRPSDMARCREIGISVYLTKPVTQSGLLNAITLTLNGVESEMIESNSNGNMSFENNYPQLHILLAEDNIVNQRLAAAILKKRGHTVVVVENGQEALQALEAERFDLILMDVQMPIMDGFEATAVIRAREQHNNHHIPIVAMTAHAMSGDRERCLNAGMDGYVSKPIQPEALLKVIKNVMATAVPDNTSSSHAQNQEAVIDWDYILAQVEGDTDLLKEVVAILLNDDLPMLMSNMQEAIEEQDCEALERTAHTLKGMVKNFGAEKVASIAQQLESMAKNGDIASAESVHDQLQLESRRLVQALTTQKELIAT